MKTLKALKAKLSNSAPPITEVEARRRLAVAEAKRAEMRLKREEGQLVNVAEVQAEWTGIAVRLRNAVLAIPAAICNRIQAEWRRDVLAAATDEVRRILTALSNEIRSTKGDPVT